ncbi:MAG: hypothetical protein OHK0022_25640 [Roseiflexaceae bacterium]
MSPSSASAPAATVAQQAPLVNVAQSNLPVQPALLDFDRPPVIAANGDLFVGVSIPCTTALPFYYYQLVTLDANKTVKARFNLGGLNYSTGLKMAANGALYVAVEGNNAESEYPSGLYAIPTGSNSPAASWSSVYGDSQNTNRAR